MTPSTHLICGVSLAAMVAACAGHWWSVRQFVAAIESGAPIVDSKVVYPATPIAPSGTFSPEPLAKTVGPIQQASALGEKAQKDFYESLIRKMENLQNQNRDLLDQMAETNRDVMKLEFRVDTHSESFRPMPVTEERSDTGLLDELGVLPPRAEPVFQFQDE